jgi:holo-[acyl-carrier protein] synthase
MIFGHGVDIAEIQRIQKAIEKSEIFKKKVFTEVEINYCESLKVKHPSYAARFAVKEAFLKALGTGWACGIAWTDIETFNDENGRPEVRLYGKAKEMFESNGLEKVHVSISHTKEIAIASVILVKG